MSVSNLHQVVVEPFFLLCLPRLLSRPISKRPHIEPLPLNQTTFCAFTLVFFLFFLTLITLAEPAGKWLQSVFSIILPQHFRIFKTFDPHFEFKKKNLSHFLSITCKQPIMPAESNNFCLPLSQIYCNHFAWFGFYVIAELRPITHWRETIGSNKYFYEFQTGWKWETNLIPSWMKKIATKMVKKRRNFICDSIKMANSKNANVPTKTVACSLHMTHLLFAWKWEFRQNFQMHKNTNFSIKI